MKANLELIIAEIVRRLPDMKLEVPENNEALLRHLLAPLVVPAAQPDPVPLVSPAENIVDSPVYVLGRLATLLSGLPTQNEIVSGDVLLTADQLAKLPEEKAVAYDRARKVLKDFIRDQVQQRSLRNAKR